MTPPGRNPRTPDREAVPAVQKLRIRYAKRGPLRFSSHRDFQRALERALRRANVPMAYSAGFSPHPKISYANAAPTGAASEAEYVEIGVVRRCDPRAVRSELDAALPPGLDILDVVEARTPDLVGRLEASRWRIELPGISVEAATAAWRQVTAASEVPVSRLMKQGRRTFDIRPALVVESARVGNADPGRAPEAHASGGGTQQGADVVAHADPTGGGLGADALRDSESPHSAGPIEAVAEAAVLTITVANVTPTVRPEEVIVALKELGGLPLAAPAKSTRLAQGPLMVDGTVGDPFTPDREQELGSVAPAPQQPALSALRERTVPGGTAPDVLGATEGSNP